MPLLISDVTAQGFIQAGVAPEDAWEYCVIGCNELGIPGRSAESATARAGTIQYLALLNQCLYQHPAPDTIDDMGQVMACLEQTMAQAAFEMRERSINRLSQTVATVPTPFTSALMRGCIARGQDMLVGMDYHLPGLYERGLTNAVNALAAIEQVVFEEKSLSLGELLKAMADDFGDKAVHQQLLAAPKWGNDDDRADRWALQLVEMRERVLNRVDEAFGQARHTVCHVVRSLHYLDGRRIAASPDGRLGKMPVADSIGAQTGTVQSGLTAMLNSVLKLDAPRYYRGGYNLNLTLPGHTSPRVVDALAQTFFRNGGQELQVNCLDANTLRAAQVHPEQYGDLLVRVAGFSARFVDLATVEQQELIARAEAM
jgi:formate C-acetyltransferase